MSGVTIVDGILLILINDSGRMVQGKDRPAVIPGTVYQ